MVRTHVMLPEALLAELDLVVEKRGRSAFVEAAIREKLQRERQLHAIGSIAGVLRDSGPAEWSTPGDASDWVEASREIDSNRSPHAR